MKRWTFLLVVVSVLIVFIGLALRLKEERKQSLRILSSCLFNLSEADRRLCFFRKFGDLAYEKGSEVSLNVLLDLQSYDKEIGGCHDVAHIIGKNLYERSPEDIPTIIRRDGELCSAGIIHGMLEAYFNSHDIALNDSLRDICGEDKDFYCSHIVGHDLLIWTNTSLEKALPICKTFLQKDKTYYCLTGAFMEYMTGQNLLPHGLITLEWFKNEATLGNVIEICKKQSGLLYIACWDMLPHVVLPTLGKNLEVAYKYCDMAENEVASRRCKNLALGLVTGKNNDIGDAFLMEAKN